MENKVNNFQNVERTQDLINSITTLVIYLKLFKENFESSFSKSEIDQSKEKVVRFLELLEPIVKQLENKNKEPIKGTDYGIRNFAQKYLDEKQKHRLRARSFLFNDSLNKIISLLRNPTFENKEETINALSQLRSLLQKEISFLDLEAWGKF